MIELYITFTAFERGKGILKFNNSLLDDCVYVDKIKDTIRNDKQKYAVLTYNPCDVHNIPMEDLFLSIDDQSFFDQLLLEIRGARIQYSSWKNEKENEQKIFEIQLLENLDDSNSSPSNIENIKHADLKHSVKIIWLF